MSSILMPGELASYYADLRDIDDAMFEVTIRAGEPMSAEAPETLRAHVSGEVTHEHCFWSIAEHIIWRAQA